jgi:hypothetical protein
LSGARPQRDAMMKRIIRISVSYIAHAPPFQPDG